MAKSLGEATKAAGDSVGTRIPLIVVDHVQNERAKEFLSRIFPASHYQLQLSAIFG